MSLRRQPPGATGQRWHEHHLTSRSVFQPRQAGLAEGGGVWIYLGQLYLIAFAFFGFDGFTLAPQKTLALTIVTVGPMMMLAPRGSITSVRVNIPTIVVCLWLLLGGLWASVGWAWEGELTFLMSWLIGCICVASVIPYRQFWNGLLCGFYLMISTQLLYCLAKGSSRVHGDGIAGWHGSFDHKTDMSLLVVLGLTTSICHDRNWRRKVCFCTQGVLLLAMGKSATITATALVSVAAYVWLKGHARDAARVGFGFLLGIVSSLVTITAVSLLILPFAVKAFGKDPTLSGRTLVWRGVIAAIRDRPLRGYGLGVWLNQAAEPVRSINRPLGFNVFHAHNGALNLILEIGFVGFLLYVWLWGTSFVLAWRKLAANPPLAHWVLVTSLATYVTSFSELGVLGPWVAVIAIGHTWLARTEAPGLPRTVRRARRGMLSAERETSSWRRRAATASR